MRFLFIWPHKDQPGYKSIGISLLSGILKRAGHEVDLFDTTFIDLGYKDNSEVRSKLKIFKSVENNLGVDLSKSKIDLEQTLVEKLNQFKPDIVGLSVLSDEMFIALKIAEMVKKWNKKTIVICGNKAASMAPETVLNCKSVDYICVGEGLEFIEEFVNAVEKNKDLTKIRNLGYRDINGIVKINELRPYFQELDSLPYLDWDIFDKRQFYKPYDGQMYVGGDHMIYWGCPNDCTYCINAAYRKLYGKNAGKLLRNYSVDRIIKELKFLVKKWDIGFLKFHDEDFCLKNLSFFKEFAQKYADELKVPFTIMANARNVNSEKIALLKKMNCVSVTLGIETGNNHLRKNILKRSESKEDIVRATKLFNDSGIRTAAFNMLAIPFETRKTIMETIALNRRAKPRSPNAGFFFPLDGTELKQIAVENGFFEKDSKKVFCNDIPSLTLPGITTDELVTLRERFILYIKMPKSFYPYIKRSEEKDEIAKQLTSRLYNIYEESVLVNDGVWKSSGKTKIYLESLNAIYKEGKNE